MKLLIMEVKTCSECLCCLSPDDYINTYRCKLLDKDLKYTNILDSIDKECPLEDVIN